LEQQSIMLEIRQLHSNYGDATVLRGVDLDVPAREVVGLLGRNGMGKTTLIRSVMGLTPPTVQSGSIKFHGQELVGSAPNRIAQLGIGLVPQGRRLFASLTVQEHIEICPQRAATGGRSGWTMARAFELFPRLGERRKHRGNQLSGGERQMLAIVRALMSNPELLLMDEPTEGLAPVMVQHVENAVRLLRDEGLSVLLVEQNLKSALALVGTAHILETGVLVYSGQAAELAQDKATLQRHLGV
jgi:branched-chain amino acid transport system ATP-binding protein